MLNKYIILAAISIFAAFAAYIVHFFIFLKYGLSDDPAGWGQFGDYMGGVLNPLLSFFSLVLLIKSLSLQNEANKDLRDELKNNEKTEKIKSFNSLFFNMINSQKSLLDNLYLCGEAFSEVNEKRGAQAIMQLEDEIDERRGKGANDNELKEFFTEVDSEDQIYGILRAFYITVKVITDRLSDANGFDSEIRKEHYLTLINFTDFSQLRLIIMGMQLTTYPSATYLRDHGEFISVLQETGLKLDPY